MAPRIPSLNSPAVDQSGQFTNEWVGFFSRLTGSPGAIATVTPTGSPFTFKAPSAGTLVISGGTSVGASLTRGRVTISVSAGAIPPLSPGDVVMVTYATAPDIAFIPRAA